MTQKSDPSLLAILQAIQEILPAEYHLALSCFEKLVVIKKKHGEQLNSIVPTMGVNDKGHVAVNEAFWNEHLSHSKGAMQFVFMHELLHHITGDVKQLRMFKKDDPEFQMKQIASAIARDARINSFLVKYYCSMTRINKREAVSFLQQYYPDEALLVNPIYHMVRPPTDDQQIDSSTLPPPLKRLAKVLWDGTLSDTDRYLVNRDPDILSYYNIYLEILAYLRTLPQDEGNSMPIPGIGTHRDDKDGEGGGSMEDLPEELVEALKDDIHETVTDKELSERKKGGNQPGIYKHLGAYIVGSVHGTEESINLESFKRISFNHTFKNIKLSSQIAMERRTTSPVIPNILAKQDIVMEILGLPPSLWKTKTYDYKYDKMLLPIYLDVSGSMWSHLPKIIKLVVNIKEDLDHIWGFSNKVARHTLEDLRENKIDSTGGTDFDCIISHAKKYDFRRIIIITDGYAHCRETAPVDFIDEAIVILTEQSDNRNNYFSIHYDTTLLLEEVTE
jgi:hypothetical protein